MNDMTGWSPEVEEERELLLEHVRTLPCCVKFTQSSLNYSDLEVVQCFCIDNSHVIHGNFHGLSCYVHPLSDFQDPIIIVNMC